MADISKLKRRSTLGAPPPLEEASQNLKAPEVAPVVAPESATPQTAAAPSQRPRNTGKAREVGHQHPTRLDGRSLRKSGRTVPFANRVSEVFDDEFRGIALRDGLKFIELLELSLDAYEAARKKK